MDGKPRYKSFPSENLSAEENELVFHMLGPGRQSRVGWCDRWSAQGLSCFPEAEAASAGLAREADALGRCRRERAEPVPVALTPNNMSSIRRGPDIFSKSRSHMTPIT